MTDRPRLNRIIELLEQGRPAFAPSVVANGAHDEIQAIGDSDYDFTIIDMEHVDFDFPTLRHSLQGLLNRRRIAESASIQPAVVPLVRIPPNAAEQNQWIIKQTLDCGAYGIVLPHLQTVEQARAAVAALRYPRPTDDATTGAGVRGWFPRHAARYWGLSIADYYAAAELWPIASPGELFLLPIVEDRAGVKNLPRILQEVRGISAIWAGAGDLSVDLGHAGQTKHPEVEAGVQAILAACLEHNIPCCTIADANDVERRLDQGFRLIVATTPRSHAALERGRAHASA